VLFFQAKAGLKTESPSSQPRTPMGDNRTLADSINENTLPRSIDPQLEVGTFSPLNTTGQILSVLRHFVFLVYGLQWRNGVHIEIDQK
jgi:hypothetical protein